MKYFILLISLVGFLNLEAQKKVDDILAADVPELPADTILFASLIRYQIQNDSSELLILSKKYKYNWLQYLPSLGVTYITGKARPIANFNFSSIFQYINEKEKRSAQLESFIAKKDLRNIHEKENLGRAIRRYKNKVELYREELKLYKLDEKLFEISEAKFKANKIKPSEYLKEKKRVHQSRMNSLANYYELLDIYMSVLEKAKFIQTYSSPSEASQSPSN